MKPWRTSSVLSGVVLSRQLGRRADSHLRHGAGSLHIKDDLLGARIDIWRRFLTVTNACALCATTCQNKWAPSDHLKRRHQRCVLDMTHAHVSLLHQSRRTPLQRVVVVLAQQRNCSGTFERIWNHILRLDICSFGRRMPSWSLELVPGLSEAEQSQQLQIKRPPRVDVSSQGTGTGQEVVGAAVDPAGRKPKSKQKNKGGAAGGDSNDPSFVSLVLSLEARLRGHGRLWPNQPLANFFDRFWPIVVLTDFGQTDFGQFWCFRVLTDFGQTDFGQFWCSSVWAKFSGVVVVLCCCCFVVLLLCCVLLCCVLLCIVVDLSWESGGAHLFWVWRCCGCGCCGCCWFGLPWTTFRQTGPLRRTAQNFAFFFLSRPHCHSFCLCGGSSR